MEALIAFPLPDGKGQSVQFHEEVEISTFPIAPAFRLQPDDMSTSGSQAPFAL
ncbi:hypothetical protein SAMN04515647_2994 [Cohaesibacter sp. ES.047]|nr:hypothetical protein SAMN04515647_2994 [Cohaesibacter sp. ES.047]